MSKFLIPALAAAALAAGCSAEPPGGDDQFAGLDQAIRAWRDDIDRTQAACQDETPGKGCQGFEVACKSERRVTPEEQARGVSAKVVAGMSWMAWDERRGEALPVSGFVQFTKTGGTWSRSAPLAGNLANCETYGPRPA